MSNIVPEGWSIKSLGVFMSSLPKSTLPSGVSDVSGYYDFYVCSEKVMKSFHKEMSSPAVLFSTGGEASVHLASGHYSYSTDVWATEFIGEICNEYVFRVLEKNLKKINYAGFQGSGIKHLDKGFVKKFPLFLPPLPEQKKIASILTSVDEAIENTQKQIYKLQDLKKATMNELLTNGIGHKEFKDSELGKIPKSWKVKRLPQICTYQNGKVFPSSEYLKSDSNGIYLIKPVNLDPDGTVNWQYSSTAKINENFWNQEPKYRVGGDEILMNLTAQSLEDEFLGRVCRTNLEDQCLLNQRIARITPILSCITNEFLFWVLKSKHFRNHVSRITQGSKVQHLYNQNLDDALLCVPSKIEEQKEISSILDALNELIKVKNIKLFQTQSLKISLMQDLLTGKVRVQLN